MARIVLSSDSTSDLSKELIEQVGLNIVPLIVNVEGKEYHDGVDITPDDLYASVEKTGNLPKTAALSIGEYLEFFNRIRENEEDIILHFSISSGFSSTYNNSLMAIEVEGLKNIYTVDSQNLSTGIGLQILYAHSLIEQGLGIDEIIEKLNDVKTRVDASFIIDKLDYLVKGGRCSKAVGLAATVLMLKPCIEVKDGKMDVGKKYRGSFDKVLGQYIRDKFANPEDIETENVFITHAGVDENVIKTVYDKVASYNIFKNIYITRAGATVSSHCGRNTLGVLFIKKTNK